MGNVLQQALGHEMCIYLRLLIFLTNNVLHHSTNARYHHFEREELEQIVQYIGKKFLIMLDRRLKPANLERSVSKLQNTQALFISVLGLSVSARLTKQNTEAFIRLLSCYLTYLARASRMIDEQAAERLAAKLQFHWDAPGAQIWKATNIEQLLSAHCLQDGSLSGGVLFFSDSSPLEDSHSDPYTLDVKSNFKIADNRLSVDTTYSRHLALRHWTFMDQSEPFVVYNAATRCALINCPKYGPLTGPLPRVLSSGLNSHGEIEHGNTMRILEKEITTLCIKNGGVREGISEQSATKEFQAATEIKYQYPNDWNVLEEEVFYPKLDSFGMWDHEPVIDRGRHDQALPSGLDDCFGLDT
ncbi:hypothetical protein N0V90_009060 [Kalmusia sp. IMI 367209]|nr:hypothetical protein N0V90_009060 [Kalmusia sp. IMI 367209]